MKLHRILMRHCSPKDSVEVTKFFVLADSEEALLACLDDPQRHITCGGWQDQSEEAEAPYEIYDAHYNIIGTETYMEKMLRLRGEFNDEDADYSDAYYGVTHWGWDEGVPITDEDAAVLLRLDIAVDWRPEMLVPEPEPTIRNLETDCVWCFGAGVRYVDIDDDNDVEVTCPYCHGTGEDKP